MHRETRVTLELRFSRRQLALLLALCALLAQPGALSTESLTLTTYYPSPYGVYNQLRSTQNTYLAYQGSNVGVGTLTPNGGAKLDVEGPGNVALNTTGNVGVGTVSPTSKLHVNGAMYVNGTGRIDQTLGVNGPFQNINGSTGLSVSGNRNLEVLGAGTGSWARLGAVWGGRAGVYAESGDLSLGAGSGRVVVGNIYPAVGGAGLYANKVDTEGSSCWTVCYGQGSVALCGGGAYVTWTDGINAPVSWMNLPNPTGGSGGPISSPGSMSWSQIDWSGCARCCF